MNTKRIGPAVALILALGIPTAVFAGVGSSNSSGSAAAEPTVTPTNPVPEGALTPGSGVLTTPRREGDAYSIPPTTPVGMPQYSITSGPIPATPPVGSQTGPTSRPTSAPDCANGGWRIYSGLAFTSQSGCEAWVRRHPARAGAGTVPAITRTRSAPTSVRAGTPRPRRTPAVVVPSFAETPAVKPTPSPR